MKTKQIMGMVLIATALLTAQPSFAKGSDPKLPTIVTTAGPCSLSNEDNNIVYYTATTREMNVEIVHSEYPGGVNVHVVRDLTTNLVFVKDVCLEPGWTISNYKMAGAWGKDQGFDITFAYNGVNALRYRMLGQGVRFDEYPAVN
jgi:hypothetical protein